MTRRAQLASEQKLSSKNNNATKENAGNARAKLFIPNGVFNLELPRIHKSDCDDIPKEHNTGIKENNPRS